MNHLTFAFFGTDDFAVRILIELKKNGFLPLLVITAPDMPVGRKQVITPPPVKTWALKNEIEVVQPETISQTFLDELQNRGTWDIFAVASYGKILPQALLDIPTHGVLNVHPSLLPHFRGADPIRSAIRNADQTGVTIMLMDDKMDHGPIIEQKVVEFETWPDTFSAVHNKLAEVGGQMLTEILLPWTRGEIKATPQNHGEATFTHKVTKADGELDIENGNPKENWRTYLAYLDWPGTYFFTERNHTKMRVKIIEADHIDNSFIIKTVLPEGKKEMSYDDFLRGAR